MDVDETALGNGNRLWVDLKMASRTLSFPGSDILAQTGQTNLEEMSLYVANLPGWTMLWMW